MKDDTAWRRRVEKALEARRQSAIIREGNPKSFRRIVGGA
jgi:hypothetical protein